MCHFVFAVYCTLEGNKPFFLYLPLVARVRSVINQAMNRVELEFAGGNMSLPSVCAKNEKNGRCEVCVVSSISVIVGSNNSLLFVCYLRDPSLK